MFATIARIAATTLVAGAALAAAPAVAADFGAARTMDVRHGDLDLTSDQGAARLNQRIAVAARAVCGSFHPADLAAKGKALACRNETIARAAPQVELAIAEARGGRQYARNDARNDARIGVAAH
ncbi:MAG: UrcA family protein [Sphingomonas bacterium]|nr:UrcA family protein [Sphingomonas bacterium]